MREAFQIRGERTLLTDAKPQKLGGGGLAQEGSNRGQGRKLNGDPITTTAILILKHFVCKSCENLDKWHCRSNSCKNDQSFITPPHSKKLKKISAANVNKISKNVYIFL